MEQIFMMTELNFLIKTVNKAEETFAISVVKVWYLTGLCSFKTTPWKTIMRLEEMDCEEHNIHLYQILRGGPESTVQY